MAIDDVELPLMAADGWVSLHRQLLHLKLEVSDFRLSGGGKPEVRDDPYYIKPKFLYIKPLLDLHYPLSPAPGPLRNGSYRVHPLKEYPPPARLGTIQYPPGGYTSWEVTVIHPVAAIWICCS